MKMHMNARCNREIEAGICTSIEAVLKFAAWADAMGSRLSADAIAAHYGCSRATSYRWLNAYRDARQRMAA